MIEIQMEGIREAMRALRKLPADVERRAVMDALRAGAAVLVKGMRRRVPKRTRRLARAITVRSRGAGMLVIGFRRPDSGRAHLIEFGTAPHTIRVRRRQVLSSGDQSFGEEVEHPGARPHPFIRPTLAEDSDEAIRAVSARLGRNVERIAIELSGGARQRFTRGMRVRRSG